MQEFYEIANGVLIRYTGREEELEVPEGICTVGEGAFKGCVSLRKLCCLRGCNVLWEMRSRAAADSRRSCFRTD